MKPVVTHDAAKRRFEAIVDGERCTLDYELSGGIMTITHTRVPDAVAGRGNAAALMEGARAHARANGWRVVPRCSYAAQYLRRHPEWSDVVADA